MRVSRNKKVVFMKLIMGKRKGGKENIFGPSRQKGNLFKE
jgi:hypothetical protein